MKSKWIFTILLLLVQVGFAGCKTYTLTVESFKEQFAQVASRENRVVTVQDPFGGRTSYKTHPLEFITVQGTKGNEVQLETSPALEIRFTDTAGKRTVFYFDLISVGEDSVQGSISRLFPTLTKTVSLSSIKRIQIQNGGKRFQYVAPR